MDYYSKSWSKLFFVLALALLAFPIQSFAGQVGLRSGDIYVCQFPANEVRFKIDDKLRTFGIQDLREWRNYHLTFSDGSILTGVHFSDKGIQISTKLGNFDISTKELAFVVFPSDTPKATVSASESSTLGDFQKESIKMISALTMQFIIIAVGVFSLAGTYLALRPGDVIRRKRMILALLSLVLLGFSVFAGYFVHSSIIGQIEARRFSSYSESTRWMGFLQLMLFLFGAILFGIIVWSNARSRGFEFSLVEENARRVFLVGSFNGWGNISRRSQYRMRRRWWKWWIKTWRIRILLAAGTYEYLFMVETRDGNTNWVQDPNCRARVPNPYGGENCMVRVI